MRAASGRIEVGIGVEGKVVLGRVACERERDRESGGGRTGAGDNGIQELGGGDEGEDAPCGGCAREATGEA